MDIDELDLQLINALQIQPRVPWARLGKVLSVDPVTLARRWERLKSEGLAWVTAYPTPATSTVSAAAIVEIEAKAGELQALTSALGQDAEAVSIDVTAGGRDLVVTVGASSNQDLYRYLLDRVETLGFVSRVHSHPVSRLLAEASQWRLRALDAVQVQSLQGSGGVPTFSHKPSAVDLPIALELARDGRASVSDIAERLSLNPRRVRESIASQISAGALRLRTDILRSHSGWPVYAWYFLSSPAGQTDHLGARLGRLDEVRAVMSVVGRYNIAMAVWMRTLDDVARLEAAIERQLPDVQIVDRSIVMRSTKQVGNLLDNDGRRRGYVPTASFPAAGG